MACIRGSDCTFRTVVTGATLGLTLAWDRGAPVLVPAWIFRTVVHLPGATAAVAGNARRRRGESEVPRPYQRADAGGQRRRRAGSFEQRRQQLRAGYHRPAEQHPWLAQHRSEEADTTHARAQGRAAGALGRHPLERREADPWTGPASRFGLLPPDRVRGGRASGQWNESPHAQDPVAFGLSIVKPCFSIVSTKSIVAPPRYGRLIRSTTRSKPPQVGAVVPVELALVEEQLVAQARATTGLHSDAQREVVATLLLEQRLDLLGGGLGEDQHVTLAVSAGRHRLPGQSRSRSCQRSSGGHSLRRTSPS